MNSNTLRESFERKIYDVINAYIAHSGLQNTSTTIIKITKTTTKASAFTPEIGEITAACKKGHFEKTYIQLTHFFSR